MYKDTRLGGTEKWYHSVPKDVNMRIRDDITKCVGFLCIKYLEGAYANTYRAFATGFLFHFTISNTKQCSLIW